MVSLLVAAYLRCPVAGVGLRSAIHGASLMPMPKAPIDEDARAQSRQGYVGRARQGLGVYAVAKAVLEKKMAHNHLWSGVARLDHAHASASLFGCHLVCHMG